MSYRFQGPRHLLGAIRRRTGSADSRAPSTYYAEHTNVGVVGAQRLTDAMFAQLSRVNPGAEVCRRSPVMHVGGPVHAVQDFVQGHNVPAGVGIYILLVIAGCLIWFVDNRTQLSGAGVTNHLLITAGCV